MGALWYLLCLGGAVNALPNKFKLAGPLRARADASAPASDFCNVTSDGKTVVGLCTAETSVNSAGLTVISATNGAITIPSGVSTPITTTFSNGDKTTITPSDLIVETTDSAGETVFSHGNSAITLSTGITTPIKTVLPNGESTTITPVVVQEGATTTTNAAGQTIISNTDGKITLSKGVTTPITTTFSDGQETTITPKSVTTTQTTTSSSGVAAGIIIPVTTSVPSPKHTAGGVVVPCNYFWFFNLCPKLDDITVRGWFIETPTGVHPPGPPPSFKPDATLSFSIPKPLPDWPQWTLPPTGPPEASPKPDNCKTDTGDVCFYHTTVSPVTTNQATTTTSKVSSTCATVAGCDVQGETSSTATTASGTPTVLTYAVYPSDGTNQAQVTAIAGQLQKFVNNPSDIIASNTKTFGLNYWLLPLDSDSVDDVRNVANVASVSPECGAVCPKGAACDFECYDPTIMRVYQTQYAQHGQNQLNYVSWRPNFPRPQNYLFDDSAGEDINVYIVDNGANLDHPEFDLVRGRTQWLVVPFANGSLPLDPHTDGMNGRFLYHGTAILSLVTGKLVGVSKKANPIIVRLPTTWTPDEDGINRYRGNTPEDWIKAVGMVLDDIGEGRPKNATSVVLLAVYYPRGLVDAGFIQRSFAQLDELSKRGAVVVTGSGNIDRDSHLPLDGWPANFGKDDAGAFSLPSLVVAGAIYPGDEYNGYSGPTSGIPHFYAPGFGVQVANGNPHTDGPSYSVYKSSKGTSDAAAMTAGLAAFFMELGRLGRLTIPDRSPLGIKRFIAENAWSRFDTGRKGIYNLAHPENDFCPWPPANAARSLRRDDTTSTCSAPTVPFTPLQKQPPVCHDEANFPGHADIHQSAVIGNADSACSRWTGSPYGSRDTKLGPNSAKLDHTYQTDGVNYEYSVEWIKGCTTTVANESVYTPTGSDEGKFTCLGIWSDCYEKCNNGGVGGSITVGCLKYTFTGGKGDD